MAFGFDDILGAVAGPLIGGLFGMNASENASNAQVQSGENAIGFQRQMYEQNRADMQPWRTAGVNALNYMTPGLAPGGEFNRNFTMDDFQADPGYDFRQSEALRRWQNLQSARGGGMGGATDPSTAAGRSFSRYNQDLASQEYGNAFNRWTSQNTGRYNRLAGVAGTGQTAANQIGAQGAALGANVGETMMGIGNARASGYVGGANALSGAVGQGLNYYSQNQLLNRLFPQAGGVGAGQDWGGGGNWGGLAPYDF